MQAAVISGRMVGRVLCGDCFDTGAANGSYFKSDFIFDLRGAPSDTGSRQTFWRLVNHKCLQKNLHCSCGVSPWMPRRANPSHPAPSSPLLFQTHPKGHTSWLPLNTCSSAGPAMARGYTSTVMDGGGVATVCHTCNGSGAESVVFVPFTERMQIIETIRSRIFIEDVTYAACWYAQPVIEESRLRARGRARNMATSHINGKQHAERRVLLISAVLEEV